MTNSDYLFKAAIKKVTEKLNEILVEKFEEATNITQQLYFQDLESLASIQFISGIVLLIFASTIFSIYFRIIRK